MFASYAAIRDACQHAWCSATAEAGRIASIGTRDCDNASIFLKVGITAHIEQYSRKALFIANAKAQGLRDIGAKNELLATCQRFGGRAHGLTMLSIVLGHVE